MCGVFGIWVTREAANLTYLGLHALQHRGQESAGIVSSDGDALHAHRQMGLVADIFTAPVLEQLPGRRGHRPRALLHRGRQPAQERPAARGRVRGRPARGRPQRQPRQRAGAARRSSRRTARSSSPTRTPRCIIHLIARSQAAHLRAARSSRRCARCEGAYSLLFLTEKQAGRRARPARLPAAGAGPAEERLRARHRDHALDLIEAEYIREIEPGEMVVIDETGLQRQQPFAAPSAGPLHLRARLLRQPRLGALRQSASTRCASSWAGSWREEQPASRRTWSSRCPTPACPRRSATRRRAASPTTWASSAATTWAAPSSSRSSRSATSA